MTALERALVVYAEAKGYEVEVFDEGHQDWEPKLSKEYFNFNFNYRIKTRGDFHKASESLFQCFTGKKTIPEMMENLKKYKPAGFSCKSGLEEVSELLEKNNVKIGINSDPNIIPNYDNFINDFVEEDLVRPKEDDFDVKAYVKSLVQTPEYLERCKEVDPIIEILGSYKNGETIERKEKYSSYEWSKLWKGHVWNFSDFDYRISPKQPEAIPATEEELKEIDRGMICIKNKQTGQFGWVMKTDPIPEGMYIFNSVSKTWQDWGRNEQR